MRRCSSAFLGVIVSFVVIASGSIAARGPHDADFASWGGQQGLSDIRGRVVDTQNAILPGVTVVVTHQDTGLYREVTSNSDGTYFVTGIVPGTYEVAAQLSGFKKSVRRDIVLSIGRTTTVDLQLEVGGVEETVTVTTQAPLVDATSPEIGGNVTRDDIVDMPSVNRNLARSSTSPIAPTSTIRPAIAARDSSWCRRRYAAADSQGNSSSAHV